MYVTIFVAISRPVRRVNLLEHVSLVLPATDILGAGHVLIIIRSPVGSEARRPSVNGFSVVAYAMN
jgi:hypothetical protein